MARYPVSARRLVSRVHVVESSPKPSSFWQTAATKKFAQALLDPALAIGTWGTDGLSDYVCGSDDDDAPLATRERSVEEIPGQHVACVTGETDDNDLPFRPLRTVDGDSIGESKLRCRFGGRVQDRRVTEQCEYPFLAGRTLGDIEETALIAVGNTLSIVVPHLLNLVPAPAGAAEKATRRTG